MLFNSNRKSTKESPAANVEVHDPQTYSLLIRYYFAETADCANVQGRRKQLGGSLGQLDLGLIFAGFILPLHIDTV